MFSTYGMTALLGLLGISLLWLVSAKHVAPGMQSHVQSHASQLLEVMPYPLAVKTDGITALVTGMVPTVESRFDVDRQLTSLHWPAQTQIQLEVDESVKQTPESSTLEDDLESFEAIFSEELKQPANLQSQTCEEYRLLDPNYPCTMLGQPNNE